MIPDPATALNTSDRSVISDVESIEAMFFLLSRSAAFWPPVLTGGDTTLPSEIARPRTVLSSGLALQHGAKKLALMATCNPYFVRNWLVVDETVFKLPCLGVE